MNPKTIKCVIVDDIQASIDAVKMQCVRYEEIEVVAEYLDSDLFLSESHRLDFDVCFLDIDMPNIRGTDVARKLQEKHIIFITGEKQEAAEAFNLNVIDFIVKPLFRNRFDDAIIKLRAKLESKHATEFYNKNKAIEKEYFFLNTSVGKVKFKHTHMRYIGHVKDGDSRDKLVILEDNQSYILKNIAIKDLLNDYLPQSHWIQVGRSDLIHRDAIQCLPSVDEVELNILDSENKRFRCTIGSSYRDEFDKKLQAISKY